MLLLLLYKEEEEIIAATVAVLLSHSVCRYRRRCYHERTSGQVWTHCQYYEPHDFLPRRRNTCCSILKAILSAMQICGIWRCCVEYWCNFQHFIKKSTLWSRTPCCQNHAESLFQCVVLSKTTRFFTDFGTKRNTIICILDYVCCLSSTVNSLYFCKKFVTATTFGKLSICEKVWWLLISTWRWLQQCSNDRQLLCVTQSFVWVMIQCRRSVSAVIQCGSGYRCEGKSCRTGLFQLLKPTN